jgi:hypothetical protein
MNTERNMKRKGSLFGSIALSLLVSVSGGLFWSGTSVQADTRAKSGGSTQSGTTTQATATAANATVDSTLSIPVSGTVMAADGTRITFGGQVVISSSAVMDVVGIPPFTMLTIDCSGVTGTSGTGANQKSYNTGGFEVIKIRELHPTDAIDLTAPINQIGNTPALARAWQVTATLNFNTTTGQLSSGSLSAVAAPAAPPQ